MKTILTITIALVFVSFSSFSQKVKKIWETTDTLLLVPESVLFADSLLYVSNVNGKPNEKNGEGFLSKVSLEGEIIEPHWCTGLNAPKGMVASNGYIFVSDIDRVAVVDLKTGEIVNTYDFPDAKFLNDVTKGNDNKIYISDMQTQSIYVIQEDFSKRLIQDDQLQSVNGLYWENDYLLVGTSNGVFKISEMGKITAHLIKNTGGIDGLDRVDANFLITSDWAGKVQLISKTADPFVLLNFEDEKYNAADIDYDVNDQIIYIPTFFSNTVVAYQLKVK